MQILMFILPRLIPLLILSGGYWYVCELNENDCSCFSSPETPKSFTIADEDSVLYASAAPDSFIRFAHSKPEPVIPKELEDSFQKIAGYLHDNNQRNLKITCFYGNKEKNRTIFPNLGLARAELLKQKLLLLNIPQNRIETISSKVSNPLFIRDYLLNGVNFEFTSNNLLPVNIEKMLQTDSVTVFFKDNSTDFECLTETLIYFENLKHYLQQNHQISVLITGHTDNSDTDEFNLILGKKRSELLKKYMTELGLPEKRIITQSMGELQPVFSNATEDERKKNRRAVVKTILKPNINSTN